MSATRETLWYNTMHLTSLFDVLRSLSGALLSLQLYSSIEFGRRWQLVHERVAPNRFYWWVLSERCSSPTAESPRNELEWSMPEVLCGRHRPHPFTPVCCTSSGVHDDAVHVTALTYRTREGTRSFSRKHWCFINLKVSVGYDFHTVYTKFGVWNELGPHWKFWNRTTFWRVSEKFLFFSSFFSTVKSNHPDMCFNAPT